MDVNNYFYTTWSKFASFFCSFSNYFFSGVTEFIWLTIVCIISENRHKSFIYLYIYNSQHVVTGNLDIITNLEIKELLNKGLNFHEQQPINRESTFNVILNAVEAYIDKICTKVKLDKQAFIPWKMELLNKVKYRIDIIPLKFVHKVLSNPVNVAYLNKLQEHFMVPVDKASKNVSLICKSYYKSILSDELVKSSNFSLVG